MIGNAEQPTLQLCGLRTKGQCKGVIIETNKVTNFTTTTLKDKWCLFFKNGRTGF